VAYFTIESNRGFVRAGPGGVLRIGGMPFFQADYFFEQITIGTANAEGQENVAFKNIGQNRFVSVDIYDRERLIVGAQNPGSSESFWLDLDTFFRSDIAIADNGLDSNHQWVAPIQVANDEFELQANQRLDRPVDSRCMFLFHPVAPHVIRAFERQGCKT